MTYHSKSQYLPTWAFYCERIIGRQIAVWTYPLVGGYSSRSLIPQRTFRWHDHLTLRGRRFIATWLFCADTLDRGHCIAISADFFRHAPPSAMWVLGAQSFGGGIVVLSDKPPYNNMGVTDANLLGWVSDYDTANDIEQDRLDFCNHYPNMRER